MDLLWERGPKLALFVIYIQMPDNTQRNGKMSRCNEKQSKFKNEVQYARVCACRDRL